MNRLFLIPLLLLALCMGTAHAAPLNVDTVREPHSLLANFTWLADTEGSYTIGTVTSGAVHDRFTSLRGGFPVEAKGKVWLHLVLTKNPTNPAQPGGNANISPPLSMKLGPLPGGAAKLFRLQTSGALVAADTWGSETIADGDEYPLPTPGSTPLHIYIQLAETPGLWFHPSVTPQASLTPPLLPLDMVLPGLFILGIAVCLLRAAKERAAWALWGALFLGACLAQTILPLPRLDMPFTYGDLPVLLAPGLALMLLPHLGRHMLQTHHQNTAQDTLLSLYSLLGLALCFLPLVPHMYWIARLFPLWPFLLIPLLPFCLWGLAAKRSGSLAFAGACVMPVIGAAITFFAIDAELPHPLAPLGTYWGLAIGGLGLCLARVQRLEKGQREDAALLLNDEEQPHPSFHELFQREPLFPEAASKPLRINKSLPDFLDPLPSTPGARQPSSGLENLGLSLSPSKQSSAPSQQAPSTKSTQPLEVSAQVELSPQETHPGTGPHPTPATAEPTRNEHENAARPLPELTMPEPAGETAPRATPADAPLLLASPTTDATAPMHPVERLDLHALSFSLTPPPAAPTAGGLDIHIPASAAFTAPAASPAQPVTSPVAEDPDTAHMPDASPAEARSAAALERAPQPAARVTVVPAASQEPAEAVASTPAFAAEPAALTPPALADRATTDSHATDSTTTDAPADAVAHTSAYAPVGVTTETAPPAPSDLDPFAASLTQTIISLTDDTPPEEYNFLSGEQPVLEHQASQTAAHTISFFHLHSLVKSVHEAVAPLAKSKGLVFSWYIAPSIPPLLEGEAASLRQALFLLLQSAVSSTAQGSVQLAVRAAVKTDQTCMLTFSISDTGGAQRSDAGFYHAWDLASRTGGTFSVEYTASTGPMVSFSVGFRCPAEDEVPEEFSIPTLPLPVESHSLRAEMPEPVQTEPDDTSLSPEEILQEQGFLEPHNGAATAAQGKVRILVADMTTSNRHLITHYLEPVDYELLEARTTETVIALGQEQPVHLIIFDGDMPEADIAKAIHAIRAAEQEYKRVPAAILALTTHEGQSRRLLALGCTHALCKPFSKSELLAQVMHCVPALRAQHPQFLQQNGGAPAQPEEDKDEGMHYVHRLLGSVEPTRRSGQAEPRSVLHISPTDVLSPLSAPEPAPHTVLGGADMALADPKAPVPGAAVPVAPSARPAAAAPAHEATAAAPAALPRTRVTVAPSAPVATPAQAPTAATPPTPSPAAPHMMNPAFGHSTLAIRIPAESAPGTPPALHPAPGATPAGENAPAQKAPAAVAEKSAAPQVATPARQGKPTEQAGHTSPGHTSNEVPFLDLIVADDEGPATPATPPHAIVAPTEAVATMPAPQPDAVAPAPVADAGAHSQGVDAPHTPQPKKRITITVNSPGKQPEKISTAALHHAALALAQKENALPPAAPALAAAPTAPAQPAPTAPRVEEQAEQAEAPVQGLPLPGIDGEVMDMTMVPLVPGLVHTLHDALRDAMNGKETRQTILVQEAAGRLAGKAEVFGLVKLGKIARCVERAAEADDLEAVTTLLEDLGTVTTRYTASMEECYQAFLQAER